MGLGGSKAERNDQYTSDSQATEEKPRQDKPRKESEQLRQDKPRKESEQLRQDKPRKESEQLRQDKPRKEGENLRQDKPRKEGENLRQEKLRKEREDSKMSAVTRNTPDDEPSGTTDDPPTCATFASSFDDAQSAGATLGASSTGDPPSASSPNDHPAWATFESPSDAWSRDTSFLDGQSAWLDTFESFSGVQLTGVTTSTSSTDDQPTGIILSPGREDRAEEEAQKPPHFPGTGTPEPSKDKETSSLDADLISFDQGATMLPERTPETQSSPDIASLGQAEATHYDDDYESYGSLSVKERVRRYNDLSGSGKTQTRPPTSLSFSSELNVAGSETWRRSLESIDPMMFQSGTFPSVHQRAQSAVYQQSSEDLRSLQHRPYSYAQQLSPQQQQQQEQQQQQRGEHHARTPPYQRYPSPPPVQQQNVGEAIPLRAVVADSQETWQPPSESQSPRQQSPPPPTLPIPSRPPPPIPSRPPPVFSSHLPYQSQFQQETHHRHPSHVPCQHDAEGTCIASSPPDSQTSMWSSEYARKPSPTAKASPFLPSPEKEAAALPGSRASGGHGNTPSAGSGQRGQDSGRRRKSQETRGKSLHQTGQTSGVAERRTSGVAERRTSGVVKKRASQVATKRVSGVTAAQTSHVAERCASNPAADDISKTVQVSGGDVVLREDLMRLYFENRKSGGGPVRNVEVNNHTGMTLITFENQTDAERVVNRSHTVSKTDLTVVPYKPSEGWTKIRVKGLTQKVSEQLLQLYFEKHGKTDSVDVQMVAGSGEAVVDFGDSEVARAVLARPHTIDGKTVTVSLDTTPLTPTSPSPPPSTPQGDHRDTITPESQGYGVEVRGLASVTTPDTVRFYFENERRSGGGDIEDLQYVKGSGQARVIFLEEEAMTRVLERHHKIDDRTLQVSKASAPQKSPTPVSRQPRSDGESASSEQTMISIRGLPATKSMDALALYFENERRSGGGTVREVHVDQESGFFFVTFENPEDAARVALRSHTLDGQRLDVRLERSPQPYEDRVQLKNLPPLQSMEELRNFVEAKSKLCVDRVLFGHAGDTAVVIFDSPIDVSTVRAALSKQTFKSFKVTVCPVPQSSTILVKDLPQHPPVSREMLSDFFENTRRNRGGEVSAIHLDEDGQYALVTFTDPEVALRVSSGQNYSLQDRLLDVSLYLECLGLSGGFSEPTASLPQDYILADGHCQKLSHLQTLPGPMQEFCESLRRRHARLDLTPGSSSIVCTLTQDVDNVRQLARTWTEDVADVVDTYLQTVLVRQLSVTAEEFDHAESQARQRVVGDREVKLTYDPTKQLLTYVCKGEEKRGVIAELETELQRKRQEHSDRFHIGKGKLQLVKTHNTVQDARAKYPQLEIVFNDDSGDLELRGLREEIQEVKLSLLETVNTITSLFHDWGSDLHKQLMSLPLARVTLESMCKGPEEVLDFSQDGFHVFSFNAERAEEAQTAARQAVQKRVIKFDENSRPTLQLNDWAKLKGSVVADHDELIVMEETPDALTLVGIGPSVQASYRRLMDFLQDNGVKQQTLELPRALHKLFEPYLNERVVEINLKKEDFVFDPDHNQIIVTGSKLCLEAAEDICRSFLETLTVKPVVYTQPSMKEFLDTAEWARKQEDLVLNAKCLVLDPEALPDACLDKLGAGKTGGAVRMSWGSAEASGGVAVGQTHGSVMSALPSLYGGQLRRRINVPAASASPPPQLIPTRPRIYLSAMSDITKEEHHVLVNSTNPALKLKEGQVSRDLLTVGGRGVQEECNANYPRGIKMGEIAVTKGGRLMCKHIIHCTLPQTTDEAKMRKSVQKMVKKCLKKAAELGHESIGFPALGTGTLAYPAPLVARVLYETTLDYGRKHRDTHLSDVFFILHKKDTELTQVFEKAHDEYRQKLEQNQAQIPEEEPDFLLPNPASQGVGNYPFFELTRGRVKRLLVGLSEEGVSWAERELMDSYNYAVVDVTERDLQLNQWEEIHKLSIINACRPMNVDVVFKYELGHLQMRGFRQNVSRIPKHITIKEAEEGVREQQAASLMMKQVQWCRIEIDMTGCRLPPYSMMSNYKIETDYQNGKDRSQIAEFVNNVQKSYFIDFTKMEEIPEDPNEQDKPRFTVIRQNKIKGAEVPPPKNWSNMQDKEIDVVPLQRNSSEYLGIKEMFMESLVIPIAKIEKIERVQNLTLYRQYQAMKQQMESHMPPDTPCEQTRLWHGTKAEAVDGIIHHGFNRSFGKQVSQDTDESAQDIVYGQGVYFATTAQYSSRNRYAQVDPFGQRNIFKCRVLVGQYTVGNSKMRFPPEIPAGGRRYDSTVDDVNNPEIFVIFNDVQAYPEYRIVFKDQ